MKKRLLSAALAAGATVLATPGMGHAIVSNAPNPEYPTFNGSINTIIHRGNTIFVGGDFNRVTDDGRTFARPGAAAFNRRTGDLLPWRPKVAGVVKDMAWSREGVYIVGKFNRVKGKPRKNVALVATRRAGKLKPLNVRVPGVVNTVGLDRGKVYLGGDFVRAAGKERTRLAAFSRRNGRLTGWAPRANRGVVNDLRVTRQGVYIGGFFHAVNDANRYQRLALVNRKKGAVIPGFNPGTRLGVVAFEVSGGSIYAGIGGIRGGGLEAVRRTDGAALWTRRFDGDVQAVKVLKGVLYAGGHYNTVCTMGDPQQPDGTCTLPEDMRRRAASFDPATGALTGWQPGMNGDMGINAFDAYGRGEQLLVGGDFTIVRGASRPGFASFHP